MKARTFNHHLTDSLKSLKRNGWMSIAAISAITVTLLLVGIFLALIFNFNKLSTDVENDVHVHVRVERSTTKKQEATLKSELKKLDDVQSVTYSSRKNELSKVVGTYGNSFKMFSGDDNPLYDVFIISTKSAKSTIKVANASEKLKYVQDASYGGDNAKKLFNVMSSLRKWGTVFTILLLFVAIFLISNTIRITILSRSNEISIMRLVGATNSYIRWPFLLEGAWTGLFGALIPIVLVDIAYGWIYHGLAGQMHAMGYALYAPGIFMFGLDILMALIGIIIGALGAIVSMRRFLKV